MNRFVKFVPSLAVVALAGTFGPTAPALAQAVPDTVGQEVLIKSTLLSFNDANVTGNYAVFHAKGSQPFRDQISADKLKEAFKSFSDQHIDIDIIAAKPPVPENEVKLDGEGVLQMNGHFDTAPKAVKYQLKFIRSEGQWKVIGIDVKVN